MPHVKGKHNDGFIHSKIITKTDTLIFSDGQSIGNVKYNSHLVLIKNIRSVIPFTKCFSILPSSSKSIFKTGNEMLKTGILEGLTWKLI